MTEGECGTDCMFIVADGELECVQTGDFVATYGAGQYFGELGLFQRPNESGVLPTRPVSVRGWSDESTVLKIWKHQLEAHPTIMKRLRPVRVQSCHLQSLILHALSRCSYSVCGMDGAGGLRDSLANQNQITIRSCVPF